MKPTFICKVHCKVLRYLQLHVALHQLTAEAQLQSLSYAQTPSGQKGGRWM